jgi:hypothetical protein
MSPAPPPTLAVVLTPSLLPRPTLTPAPTQPPEPTPTPPTVHVGSTSGQAVYLYNSPTVGNRIQAYPEGTPLQVIGGDVEGDGLTWRNVRAPDGTEGYIPVDDTKE